MGVKSVLTIPKDSTKLVKTRIELILYKKKRNENYIDINKKKLQTRIYIIIGFWDIIY